MLQKIDNNLNENYLHWVNISPDSIGEGLCFVRSAVHRFTKGDKPYFVLYLQDIDGGVIPGYIFDIANFVELGKDLTAVERSVVKISYRENYHPKYGLSVILEKVDKVVSPDTEMLGKFTSTAKEAKEAWQELGTVLSEKLKMMIKIPYNICTASSIECCNGAIGGPAIFYKKMMQILEQYETEFSEEERRDLWGSFLIYIFVHSNLLTARKSGEDDIQFLRNLTLTVDTYLKTLKIGVGAAEAIYMSSGYQPKDIYTRLVSHVADNVSCILKEINLYRTLPISREGDAGYGTIKNYGKKHNESS